MAEMLLERQQYQDAREVLEPASLAALNDARVWELYAGALVPSPPEAIAAYRTAIRLSPDRKHRQSIQRKIRVLASQAR